MSRLVMLMCPDLADRVVNSSVSSSLGLLLHSARHQLIAAECFQRVH